MKHFAFVLPLIWLIGCLQSLHPLYRDGDITFDPAVAGTWTDENAKCRAVARRGPVRHRAKGSPYWQARRVSRQPARGG